MGSGDHPARRLERRWARRYSFRADLEIEWGSAVLRASTRDISANGMFIEAVDPLWIGAGFTARLNLKQPLKGDCSVNRTGARHGRFRGTRRIRKPETLPGSSFLALRHRRLRAIYTRGGRGLVCVQPGEE